MTVRQRSGLCARSSGMNRNQVIAIAIAAVNMAIVLLFPPFDSYSISKTQIPVFSGFYFYPSRLDSMVVNSSLLMLESFVVAINAGIAVLLLRTRSFTPRRRLSMQNATLILVAVNLVVILLFPPFESVFAMTKASIPTFEGFYFIFARQQNHVIVTPIIYLEVIFVLLNGIIFWLFFREKQNRAPTAKEAMKVVTALRSGGN